MPEKRHRTVIEIGVDDRKIKGLDETLHRAFDDELLEGFERVLERSAKTLDTMTKTAERFDRIMRQPGAGKSRIPPSGGGGDGGGGGGGGDLRAAIVTLTSSINKLQEANRGTAGAAGRGAFGGSAIGSYMGSYLGGLANRATGEGLVSQALGGIPLVGGLLGGAVNSIQRYYGMYAAGEVQRSRTVGALGRARAGRGLGRFGFAGPEAQQQASQIASSAALSGDALTDDFVYRAMQLQMLGGVQGAGSVARGVGVGRSGPHTMGFAPQGPERSMMLAVSTGIQSGIREARLGPFVQAATQVLEQGRTEGAEVELGSVLGIMRGLSGLGSGWEGERAQRALGSTMSTMRGFSPGTDVSSLIGLRAAGFGTEGVGYHEALQRFQEEPARVLPQLIREVRGMAPGNQRAQVELMRQVMPRFMGFTPTVRQLRSLVGGDLSEFTGGMGTEEAEDFIARRADRVGGAFGTAATEAQYRNRQLGVGRQVAGAAQLVRGVEMTVAGQTLPRIATAVEGIFEWLEGTFATFQESGMSGLIREMLEGVFPDLPTAGDIETAVANAGRRTLGAIQGSINDTAALIAESVGADLETQNDFRRTAAAGWRMAEGAEDVVSPTGPGARGEIQPGAQVPAAVSDVTSGAATDAGDDMGPQSALGDELRRARDALDSAATAADRVGLAGEGELALG